MDKVQTIYQRSEQWNVPTITRQISDFISVSNIIWHKHNVIYHVSSELWATKSFSGTRDFEKVVWHWKLFHFSCKHLSVCLRWVQPTSVIILQQRILCMIWPSHHFADKNQTHLNAYQAYKNIPSSMLKCIFMLFSLDTY